MTPVLFSSSLNLLRVCLRALAALLAHSGIRVSPMSDEWLKLQEGRRPR